MADNTLLNPGAAGDTVRDIDRSLNPTPGTSKTQVVQIDVGGQNQEVLASAVTPVPIDSPALRVQQSMVIAHTLLLAAAPTNGFTPMEIPSFIGAL